MPGNIRPASGVAGSPEYFPNLDAIRGIAALMVALYHVCTTAFNDPAGARRLASNVNTAVDMWWEAAFRVAGNGPGAVILFFVLSGFVLALVLERGSRADWAGARDFLAARAFRIYPAVVATLCIFGLLFVTTGHSLVPAGSNTLPNYLKNMALLQPVIVGPTWSLTLEMLAAPLIFASWCAWRRFGLTGLLGPYVVLVGLSYSISWNHLIGEPGSLGQIHAFVAGMLTFLYGRPIIASLKHPGAWLLFAILGFAAAQFLFGWGSHTTVWVETIFGSAVVALLAFGPFQPTSRAFRVATYFGRISFSFYLLHPLTLMARPLSAQPLADVLDRQYHPLLICTVLFLASVAFITPLAALQYALVESTFSRMRSVNRRAKVPRAALAKANRVIESG